MRAEELSVKKWYSEECGMSSLEARGRKICFAARLEFMHSGGELRFGVAEARCAPLRFRLNR